MRKHRSLVLVVTLACTALASAVGLGTIRQDSLNPPIPRSQDAQGFGGTESTLHGAGRTHIRGRLASPGGMVADHLFCIDGSDTHCRTTGRFILDADNALDGLDTSPFYAPLADASGPIFARLINAGEEAVRFDILVLDEHEGAFALHARDLIGTSYSGRIDLLSIVTTVDLELTRNPGDCDLVAICDCATITTGTGCPPCWAPMLGR